MVRGAATLLVVVSLAIIAYNYRVLIETKIIPACSRPLSYKVSPPDSRFGISEDRFKQAIADAEQIWEKAAGRQLFVYDPNGAMPISLVYDNRQQATDQLKKIGVSLDSTQSSYDKLLATYKQYQNKYTIDKQKYEEAEEKYNINKLAYEQAATDANNRGGASKQEYAELNRQLKQLNTEIEQLNQQGDLLNLEVKTINALVVSLNRIGGELNLNAEAYNTIGQSLNEFNEGIFTSNGTNKEIIIYQFDNYNMLVRVLAHELGHSLGMEHVPDSQAIMYQLNQSTNEKPTVSDLAELKRICKF